jgi:hypothetical protein
MYRLPRLRLIVLAVLSATLAGCLLLPGKFDSTLDLQRDGTFHFHYAGELVLLPLTEAAHAQLASGLGKVPRAAPPEQIEVFTEQTCTRPGSGEARACTAEEIAAQHNAWDKRKAAAASDAQAGAALALLGGINPNDPRAAAAFADALRRQAGWRKVDYKGDGVFDVEYDVTGRLDHDFVFPTLEHQTTIVPLVMVIRHADGSVRVEAPGFAPGLGNLSALGAALPASAKNNAFKGLPAMDGTFAITTSGAILANNTEDGPAAADGGSQRLGWKVSAGRAAAPTALIRPY